MENEAIVKVQDDFGTEIAKAFILSMAATAGMFAGVAIVGAGAGFVRNRRKARKAKRTQEEN